MGVSFLSGADSAMVLSVIGFFRTNDKNEHLDENNFSHCYGDFSRNYCSAS